MKSEVKHYNEITSEDWKQWEWAPFDNFSDLYVRTYKKTEPPNDGYEYIDVTSAGDAEQKWARGLLKED